MGLVGAVGWIVALLTLVAAFLGRWLDARSGTGVFWTLSLLFAGLTFGCAAAWRHVREGLHQ